MTELARAVYGVILSTKFPYLATPSRISQALDAPKSSTSSSWIDVKKMDVPVKCCSPLFIPQPIATTMTTIAADGAEPRIAHPDGRPYPWLTSSARSVNDPAAAAADALRERFLIYQPFAGMCNQFSCLESATAIARTTGRTLVLPRWRPQYGWPWLGATADYFDVAPLSQLVRCITLEEFAAARTGAAPGEGVALFRLALAYNPTWSDKGFGLYPDLRSLLVELEYFREVDSAGVLKLGCGGGGGGGGGGGDYGGGALGAELQRSLTLDRPLRGEREISALFGDVRQPVLALDHSFNTVALPSVFDAGERALLLSALKPNERLRAKLNGFMGKRVPRPCLAAHVRRTDHWRLSELMGDVRFWPAIEGFVRQIGEQVMIP